MVLPKKISEMNMVSLGFWQYFEARKSI